MMKLAPQVNTALELLKQPDMRPIWSEARSGIL